MGLNLLTVSDLNSRMCYSRAYFKPPSPPGKSVKRALGVGVVLGAESSQQYERKLFRNTFF